jgi:hypothetical protein
MRRMSLKVVVVLFAAFSLIGCGKKEAAIPTNLDQPIPKAAGSDGGPKPAAKNDKKASPGAAAD